MSTEEQVNATPVEENVSEEVAHPVASATMTEDKAIFSVSRAALKLAIKIVIAVVIGLLLAFVAPPLIQWLSGLSRQTWYVIGCIAAVVISVVAALRWKG